MSNTRKAAGRRTPPRDRYTRQDSAPRRQHRTETADRPVTARRPAREPEREYPEFEVYDAAEAADDATAQEIDARGAYVTASLCGEPVRIIPPGAWRQSWMRALGRGDLDSFAEQVIHPDDLDLYDDLDPTNDEFGEFVNDASLLAGESLGKSAGPNRSSRRTRRR
jgi:hypothetical protein